MKRKRTVALFLSLVWILTLVGCGGIKAPKSAADYSGASYQSVVDELTELGFTNIVTEEVDDLTADTISDENSVAYVTMDGNNSFQKGDSFKKDTPIIVGYHTPQQIAVPVSSDELQTMDYLEIAQTFSEAGFTDVETESVEDRDPDTMDAEFFNEVSVDYTSDFAQEDTYAFNSEVKVVRHLPYKKHDVNIHIDFFENLIFSRYDVDYSIDGVVDDTLSHGQDKDLSFRLKEGSYTLTFSERGSSSNSTDLTLDVNDDIEAAYSLRCESGNIRIETLYVEKKHAAGEGQAMAPDSASNLSYGNYQETVAKLEQAGFTNVKAEAVYDIIFGITNEGEVESVTIGETSNFNRGDVFDADEPVVVVYHMNEEDDPSKQTPEQSDNPEPPETSSEEPTRVFYSTNDYETAKNGNSGVFSYVDSGASYDIYWIVDFDAGYVYFFTEGNGNEDCDRLKIESGDLNSVLIITYHDGGEEWSYGLHFNYKNDPSKLIMQDNDGFEYEYTTTDLTRALELRDSKTICDY